MVSQGIYRKENTRCESMCRRLSKLVLQLILLSAGCRCQVVRFLHRATIPPFGDDRNCHIDRLLCFTQYPSDTQQNWYRSLIEKLKNPNSFLNTLGLSSPVDGTRNERCRLKSMKCNCVHEISLPETPASDDEEIKSSVRERQRETVRRSYAETEI